MEQERDQPLESSLSAGLPLCPGVKTHPRARAFLPLESAVSHLSGIDAREGGGWGEVGVSPSDCPVRAASGVEQQTPAKLVISASYVTFWILRPDSKSPVLRSLALVSLRRREHNKSTQLRPFTDVTKGQACSSWIHMP